MPTEEQKVIILQQQNANYLGSKFSSWLNFDLATITAIKNYFYHLIFEKQYSQHTIIAYQEDLASFFYYIFKLSEYRDRKIDLEQLNNINIKDLRLWLTAEFSNQNNRSKARSLATIRSFFRFINLHKIINNQEIEKISNPKIAKLLPKTVKSEDIITIVKAIQQQQKPEWEKNRDLAIFLLLYGSGLRISEALLLSKGAINSDNLAKIIGKGSKERLVPILPLTLEIINLYLKELPFKILDQQPMFINNKKKIITTNYFNSLIVNIRRQYNLPEHITPHSFRHACASDLLANGANLRIIQSLLGHQNLATTEIYTKVDGKKIINDYNKFFRR